MEDKTQQYRDIIEPSIRHISAQATLNDIPFIAVFQTTDDHFVLSHNIGEDAHDERKQNVEWWTDYLDGKYDKKTIITEEDMKSANATIEKIIEYVKSKGFKAIVDPQDEYSIVKQLRIFKMVNGRQVYSDCSISVAAAACAPIMHWEVMADHSMQQVDEAIEKGPPELIKAPFGRLSTDQPHDRPLTVQELLQTILDITNHAYADGGTTIATRTAIADIMRLCETQLNMHKCDWFEGINENDIYKFNMTASFLRAYAGYLEAINAQNGKSHVLQLQVNLSGETVIPPLGIVEEEKQ